MLYKIKSRLNACAIAQPSLDFIKHIIFQLRGFKDKDVDLSRHRYIDTKFYTYKKDVKIKPEKR